MKKIVDIAGELNGVAQLVTAIASINPDLEDGLIILVEKLDELTEDILAYAKAPKETVGKKQ